MNDQPYDPLAAEKPSGMQQSLGYRIVEWREDYSRVEQPIHPGIGNRHGIPHGGAIATVIDVAAGHAGTYSPMPGQRLMAMTLSLNINYVAQTNGKLLIAEGRRTGGGKRIYYSEVRVTDDNGALIATGQAVMRYRSDSVAS
ncbi:MAG TPA: PaaI family thioesterase [Devosiaceae bacterium]|jgi:uncharacterized protein (TIGR00369 family)